MGLNAGADIRVAHPDFADLVIVPDDMLFVVLTALLLPKRRRKISACDEQITLTLDYVRRGGVPKVKISENT